MRFLLVFIPFLLGTVLLSAQSKEEEGRFTATIIAGAAFTQIDGDEDASYSKVGFIGGVRGGVILGPRMELATEILFSQKGSYIQNLDKTYHLDYVEVPVMFYYKDWKATDANSDHEYMRVAIGAGFSYSRLLNSRVRQFGTVTSDQPGYVDPFLKNDFMLVIDANIFFLHNWGIGLRWSRSLTTIVQQPLRQQISYAINRSIAIRALFRF
ncbi:MAG: porin family protein [Aureispira sp.]